MATVRRIASATRGTADRGLVPLRQRGPVRPGDIVVVEVLEEKPVYNQLELPSGHLVRLRRGDVIAGVLGARRALRGFVGDCPRYVRAGDVLHLLNLGGVIGRAISGYADLGPPTPVRVLGLALGPRGTKNIAEGAIGPAKRLSRPVPLIVVAGTCMAAGKTHAAAAIIAGLSRRGLRVAALKLTGVAALRDVRILEHHGAVASLSFLDAGYPSTADVGNVAGMARGLLNAVAGSLPDVVVVELGDGILGSYGVASFYGDAALRRLVAAHVMCAGDLVGAWGAVQLAARLGRPVDIVTGPATDTLVGERYIENELAVPAANARTAGPRLADLVARRLALRRPS